MKGTEVTIAISKLDTILSRLSSIESRLVSIESRIVSNSVSDSNLERDAIFELDEWQDICEMRRFEKLSELNKLVLMQLSQILCYSSPKNPEIKVWMLIASSYRIDMVKDQLEEHLNCANRLIHILCQKGVYLKKIDVIIAKPFCQTLDQIFRKYGFYQIPDLLLAIKTLKELTSDF